MRLLPFRRSAIMRCCGDIQQQPCDHAVTEGAEEQRGVVKGRHLIRTAEPLNDLCKMLPVSRYRCCRHDKVWHGGGTARRNLDPCLEDPQRNPVGQQDLAPQKVNSSNAGGALVDRI